jgi:hypothetical protein
VTRLTAQVARLCHREGANDQREEATDLDGLPPGGRVRASLRGLDYVLRRRRDDMAQAEGRQEGTRRRMAGIAVPNLAVVKCLIIRGTSCTHLFRAGDTVSLTGLVHG